MPLSAAKPATKVAPQWPVPAKSAGADSNTPVSGCVFRHPTSLLLAVYRGFSPFGCGHRRATSAQHLVIRLLESAPQFASRCMRDILRLMPRRKAETMLTERLKAAIDS